jgi:hypothetical protein
MIDSVLFLIFLLAIFLFNRWEQAQEVQKRADVGSGREAIELLGMRNKRVTRILLPCSRINAWTAIKVKARFFRKRRSSAKLVLEFYQYTEEETSINRKGYSSRTQVLQFDAKQAETSHNFIQLLFPLSEPSKLAPGTPYLKDKETLEAIRKYFAADSGREVLLTNVMFIMKFWGLEVIEGAKNISIKPYATGFFNLEGRKDAVTAHNYARMVRVVKSLRLLGYPQWAEQIRLALEAAYADKSIEAGYLWAAEFLKKPSDSAVAAVAEDFRSSSPERLEPAFESAKTVRSEDPASPTL